MGYAPIIIYKREEISTELQYTNRQEAEQAMFLKSFEILEER